MKKLMMLSAATMIALGAWAASAAPNFPHGTHIMRGSLKGFDEDGRNVILSSSRNMTIRAVNANGQVIAESKVKDPTAEGYNFALLVPLSTTATDSTCAVGDKLNCVIVEQGGLSISTSPVTVGGAREAHAISFEYVGGHPRACGRRGARSRPRGVEWLGYGTRHLAGACDGLLRRAAAGLRRRTSHYGVWTVCDGGGV